MVRNANTIRADHKIWCPFVMRAYTESVGQDEVIVNQKRSCDGGEVSKHLDPDGFDFLDAIEWILWRWEIRGMAI